MGPECNINGSSPYVHGYPISPSLFFEGGPMAETNPVQYFRVPTECLREAGRILLRNALPNKPNAWVLRFDLRAISTLKPMTTSGVRV